MTNSYHISTVQWSRSVLIGMKCFSILRTFQYCPCRLTRHIYSQQQYLNAHTYLATTFVLDTIHPVLLSAQAYDRPTSNSPIGINLCMELPPESLSCLLAAPCSDVGYCSRRHENESETKPGSNIDIKEVIRVRHLRHNALLVVTVDED